MEGELIKIFKERGLSETSIKSYVSKVKLIAKEMKEENLNFIDKKEKVKKCIENKYINDTIRSNLYNVLYIIALNKKDDKLIVFYKDLMKESKKMSDESRGENKKSEREDENWMRWEDILNHTKKMKERLEMNKKVRKDSEIEKEYQDYIIVVLYTLCPPLRIQEYQKMVIKEKEDKKEEKNKNYMYLDENGKIRVKIYKSKNIKKLVEGNVDYIEHKLWIEGEEEIKKYVKYLKSINRWKEGGYLLYVKNMEKEMGETTIIKRIKKIYGEYVPSMTVSIIRKSYETYLQNSEEYKNLTVNEKKAKHREILHSYMTGQEYKKF